MTMTRDEKRSKDSFDESVQWSTYTETLHLNKWKTKQFYLQFSFDFKLVKTTRKTDLSWFILVILLTVVVQPVRKRAIKESTFSTKK
jgi:hypothetical protein